MTSVLKLLIKLIGFFILNTIINKFKKLKISKINNLINLILFFNN